MLHVTYASIVNKVCTYIYGTQYIEVQGIETMLGNRLGSAFLCRSLITHACKRIMLENFPSCTERPIQFEVVEPSKCVIPCVTQHVQASNIISKVNPEIQFTHSSVLYQRVAVHSQWISATASTLHAHGPEMIVAGLVPDICQHRQHTIHSNTFAHYSESTVQLPAKQLVS